MIAYCNVTIQIIYIPCHVMHTLLQEDEQLVLDGLEFMKIFADVSV